jgi:hypothetical protein
MLDISCIVAPSPVGDFFEKAIIQQRLGQRLFELSRLAAQFLDLVSLLAWRGVCRQRPSRRCLSSWSSSFLLQVTMRQKPLLFKHPVWSAYR